MSSPFELFQSAHSMYKLARNKVPFCLLRLRYPAPLLKAQVLSFCRMQRIATQSLFWKVNLLPWRPGTSYVQWRRSKLSPRYKMAKQPVREAKEVQSDARWAASSFLELQHLSVWLVRTAVCKQTKQENTPKNKTKKKTGKKNQTKKPKNKAGCQIFGERIAVFENKGGNAKL